MNKAFNHVLRPEAPRLIHAAMKFYGLKEFAGPRSNPVIMSWAKELEQKLEVKGLIDRTFAYSDDSVPWCGLGMAKFALDAGHKEIIPRTPLWARSFGSTGVDAPVPMFGDVLVFTRKGGGHVGLYVGEGPGVYYVLGGNQHDSVSIVEISKGRLWRARHPKWKVGPPVLRRRYHIEIDMQRSENER